MKSKIVLSSIYVTAIMLLNGCAVEKYDAAKHVNESNKLENKMKTIWDLSDLYQSPSDNCIIEDKLRVEKLAASFRADYKNRVSIENLKDAVLRYEAITVQRCKLSLYSHLYTCTRQNDDNALSFSQSMSEWSSDIESKLVFFTIEIANLDPNALNKITEKDIELAKYKSWILEIIKYKKHLLETNTEEALSKKDLAADNAWRKFYQETLTRIEVVFKGKKVRLPDLLEIASESSDSKTREHAFRAVSKRLKEENFYVKHIYNNILLNRSVEDKLRNYENSESFRHLSNNIDKKAVDALTDAVVNSYTKISHRYYKLKAKLLGKEKIEYWDRNAPINLSSILSKKIPYELGAKMVLDVFGKFSKTFEDIASDFINKGWIDVYAKKGKTGGAFATGGYSPEIHPYVLLNYFETISDVSTLAHELGHGVHFSLSMKNGPLLSWAPITIAETASLFAEQLLFEEIYKSTKTKYEKIDLLCKKIEKIINSSIRQIAFFEFEREAHKLRKTKELTCDEISKTYLKALRKYLGDSVNVDECVGDTWSYVQHFFVSPFYVYGYAFGELYVNALYEEYKKAGQSFIKKYIDMLSKGSIDRYDVAASKFGLDPAKKEFWEKALVSIEKEVIELEKLCTNTD